MAKGDIYTVRHGDKWANTIGGNSRASKVYDTQREAIADARNRAIRDGLEHTIQGRNGQFREKNSYGNDPRNIKG
ncbi:hypothetical protein D3C77_661460 [compost metagenome]